MFRSETLGISTTMGNVLDMSNAIAGGDYDAAIETAFAALRLPPYLGATSPPRVWCDILQGYPASN